MIDIIVLAIPADRARAEAVLDGLFEAEVAGPNRTRFLTEHPLDAGWTEAARAAANCPCVIFCWSMATLAEDAEPFRRLAAEVQARDHALSVELDKGTRPAALRGSTTYPLYGWHAHPRGWGRFVFGNRFVMQIAVAAKRKVSGQDPPPPQALWRMMRGQAWAVVVGFCAILGVVGTVWDLSTDSVVGKWFDARAGKEFAAAKGSCDTLRVFIDKHQGSAWTDDARELLATCTIRQQVKRSNATMEVVVFGITRLEAEADSRSRCEGLARTSGGTLISSNLQRFEAGGSSTAACVIDQPMSVSVETMGDTTP